MNNMTTDLLEAAAVVKRLGLHPHPEGGWFKETWRGPAERNGDRAIGTSILFLLDKGERSRWHRVDATEIWLHHAGGPLRLFTASPASASAVVEHRLGPDVVSGDQVQHVIATGEWQSAQAEDGWSLVSCVVVPAFEFSGFELAPEGWQPGMNSASA